MVYSLQAESDQRTRDEASALAGLPLKGPPLIVKEVHAGMFVLEDPSRKMRATLAMVKDGPGLALFDESGKPRATLAAFEDRTELFLYDEKGNPRAGLVVTKDGSGLSLTDEKGNARAALGTTQTTTPDGKTVTYPESSLLLFGPDGKGIWQAP
jgi:hypothetical protein